MKETGFKNYFVDEKGDVFSTKQGSEKKLATKISKRGYVFVRLFIDGKEKSHLVHRLTAKAYILNPYGLEQVNHIDGDKTNNFAENLEWVTAKENIQHAYETGLTKIGENHSRAKYSDELLLKALKEIQDGNSVKSTSKKFGISQSYLNKVNNGVYRKDLSKNRTFND